MVDTAAVMVTMAIVAAVGDRPIEVRAIETQTVTGMGNAARSRWNATVGPTGMSPTRV